MGGIYKQIRGIKSKQEVIDVYKHRNGRLYLWEESEICDGVASATVISNKYAEKKRPLFVKENQAMKGRYAAIPVNVGDILTRVRCDYNFNMTVIIYRLDEIIVDELNHRHYGVLTEVDSFNDGIWRTSSHEKYECSLKRAMIQATPLRDTTIHTKSWHKGNKHRSEKSLNM